jgi:hypothetical protein
LLMLVRLLVLLVHLLVLTYFAFSRGRAAGVRRAEK